MIRALILALSPALLLAIAGQAAAQGTSQPARCFEVIAAERNVPPGAPILVNRCSGETFVLSRTGRDGQQTATLQWVPIDKATAGGAREAPQRGAPANTAKRAPAGCFSYDGRVFCP